LRIAFTGLVLIGMVVVAACGGPSSAQTTREETVPGQNTFNNNCALCHGKDGQKQFNGASDLSVSTLSREERIAVITNGRSTMIAYKGALTKKEIEDVADYVATLKQ